MNTSYKEPKIKYPNRKLIANDNIEINRKASFAYDIICNKIKLLQRQFLLYYN